MGIRGKIAEKLHAASRRKQLMGAVACIAAVAVLGTVVVFSGTGYTKTGSTYCGFADHEHTEECYLAPLTCMFDPGDADYVLHTHTRACYDETGNLVCPLEALTAHVHTAACYQDPSTGHYAHDESCYGTVETLICGQEEVPAHTHDESCYDATGALICNQAETHQHGDDCYDSDGELVCTREELLPHEHTSECYHIDEHVLICGHEILDEAPPVQVHVHGPACYTTVQGELICDQEETGTHVHTAACYGPKSVEGHVHTADCYELTEAAHVHTEACYAAAGEAHEHTDDCYEIILGEPTCGLEESEGHEHDKSCYTEGSEGHAHSAECYHDHDESCWLETRALTCGLNESIGHTHDESCYVDEILVCGQEESEGHEHDESCYTVTKTLVCGIGSESTDHVLICELQETPAVAPELKCGLKETPAHEHTDECYGNAVTHLVCGEQAASDHEHTENCYTTVRGRLICGRTESVEHVHDDTCYEALEILTCQRELICGQASENHVHTDSCFASVRGDLICTDDHAHDASCYETVRINTCGTELACDGMDTGEAHVHTDDCRITVRGELVCNLEESEGHTHGPDCYLNGELVCDLEESEGHRHDDSCYSTEEILICENELVCTEETGGHVHDKSCYATETMAICGKEPGEPEYAPVCGKLELELHVHSDACLADPDTMHVHDESCYRDGIDVPVCGKLAASDCELTADGMAIICGKPVVIEHVHDASCFGEIPEDAEPICGKHVHTEACYHRDGRVVVTETDDPDGISDEVMEICPDCGRAIHVHDSNCAKDVYSCGLEEHTHDPEICGEDCDKIEHNHEAEGCVLIEHGCPYEEHLGCEVEANWENSPEITGSMTDDEGVEIHVNAHPGAFPEGTELIIEPLGNKHFEVTFMWEGHELEPRDGNLVDVTFKVPASALNDDTVSLQVEHIADDGEVTDVGDSVEIDQDSHEYELTVSVDQFSIYGVLTDMILGEPESVTGGSKMLLLDGTILGVSVISNAVGADSDTMSFELPATGGEGVFGYIAVGAGMVVLAVGSICVFRKRKQS